MQTLKKLMRIFDRATKMQFLVLLVAIIIGAALETSAIALISPLISVLLDNTAVETNRYLKLLFDFFGFTNVNSFLALLAFSLAAVYLFRGVYAYTLTRVQLRFIARRQVRLADRLLRKVLGYPYLYHAGKNIAELQTTITNDSVNMFIMITNLLLLITDLLMILFMLIFLLIVSPAITIGMIVLSLLFTFLYFKVFRNEIESSGRRRRSANVGMRKSVNQALGGIKEVKLLRREDFFHKIFKDSSDEYVKAQTRFSSLDALPRFLFESVFFCSAFVIIGVMMLTGADITGFIPQLSVFVLAALRILPAVTRSVGKVNIVINNLVSVEAVYKSLFEEEFDAKLLLPEADLSFPNGVEFLENKSDILVRNVTFTYPKMPMPVLEGVSLDIPMNKSVAFVGPTGAGKTTLADIILGVLDPGSGGVFYEGKPVHHNFDMWAQNVGYIPQQIYLLDESILNNVVFGIERSDINEDKVWYALEQAQLADFVQSLPEGIETVVGDRGIRLSGGQRQRVGIARALYNNPSILVLDEATSSLDTETEQAVMEAIEKFQGEKTMIIIAHRLSTIEHCDIVYRVEDGRVVRER